MNRNQYEIAIVDGAGRCRLRKLIPMNGMPHIGVSGPVSSNLPIYHRKVDLYEGSADECQAMSAALRRASNPTCPAAERSEVRCDGLLDANKSIGEKP